MEASSQMNNATLFTLLSATDTLIYLFNQTNNIDIYSPLENKRPKIEILLQFK